MDLFLLETIAHIVLRALIHLEGQLNVRIAQVDIIRMLVLMIVPFVLRVSIVRMDSSLKIARQAHTQSQEPLLALHALLDIAACRCLLPPWPSA